MAKDERMRSMKDRWASDSSAIYGFSQCFTCKHFHVDSNGDTGLYSCAAFSVIPERIYDNEIKHNERVPEQMNDIVYEAV